MPSNVLLGCECCVRVAWSESHSLLLFLRLAANFWMDSMTFWFYIYVYIVSWSISFWCISAAYLVAGSHILVGGDIPLPFSCIFVLATLEVISLILFFGLFVLSLWYVIDVMNWMPCGHCDQVNYNVNCIDVESMKTNQGIKLVHVLTFRTELFT